jgi:hypothetical protein
VPAAWETEPAAEPTANPAVGPSAGSETEPAAGVAADPAITLVAAPAAMVEVGVRCQTCGAAVPEGDVFCGDCGTPIAGAATMYAGQPAQSQPAMQGGVARAYQPPHRHGAGQRRVAGGGSSFADHLSFNALFTGEFAVAVFWVAEGVNLVYWILHWSNNSYGGAKAFLWSAAGFVLIAIIIRILVEAAVSAGRVKDEVAALREDRGKN